MPKPTTHDESYEDFCATEYVYLTQDAEYQEAMQLFPSEWYDTSDDYEREAWDYDDE